MSNIANLPVVSSEASLSIYLREINAIASLTKEEEFMLAKAYLETQDLEAAHKLVKSHLKLVAKIAMRYRNYGLPVTELISEGNIGLMQAVKKFNPDLGYRLSTYSMWWIKAAIQEYVLRSWSLVRIGTTSAQKKLFFSLGKIKHKIANIYSRAINESDFVEIAKDLGVEAHEVGEMNMRLSGPDLSLNRPLDIDSEDGAEMIEMLPENKPLQEDIVSHKQLASNRSQVLSEALMSLNEREVQIFSARKLIDNPLTLDALSMQYNISKERVRQIETRAFEKVQNYVLARMSGDGQMKIVSE